MYFRISCGSPHRLCEELKFWEITTEKRKKLTKWLIGVVSACILVFLGVQNIGVVADAVSWVTGLIMPLLIGLAFALVLNVPMRFFEAHLWSKTKKKGLQKLRSPLSFLISLVLILGGLAGAVWLVIPELAGTVGMLLAVPIASTLYVLIKEATDRRENRLNNKA